MDQGRVKDALAVFREALKSAPGDVGILNNLGVALRNEGDLAGSLVALQRCGEAHRDLGAVFRKQGKSEQAAVELKEAVRLLPDDPSIRYILAQILQKTGHSPEAAAQLQVPRRKINSKGIETSPIAT